MNIRSRAPKSQRMGSNIQTQLETPYQANQGHKVFSHGSNAGRRSNRALGSDIVAENMQKHEKGSSSLKCKESEW
jgi:hypothetical protein